MELHHSSEPEAPEKVTKLFLNTPLVQLRLPRMPMPGTRGTYGTMLHEGTTDTMDTLHRTMRREDSITAPCMRRTRRRRAPTTIRAFRTFSLDRGAGVWRWQRRSHRMRNLQSKSICGGHRCACQS